MYIILELQKLSDTQVAVAPAIQRENELEAESEYHRVLSAAAISSVPRHTVIFVRDDGYLYDYKSYEHTQEGS